MSAGGLVGDEDAIAEGALVAYGEAKERLAMQSVMVRSQLGRADEDASSC